jgi:hypothetical protein
MRAGLDPADPTAQELARRWFALVREFTGGDPGIFNALKSMYQNENTIHGMDVAAMRPTMEYIGKAAAERQERHRGDPRDRPIPIRACGVQWISRLPHLRLPHPQNPTWQESTMRAIILKARRPVSALVAAVLVLGFVAEANAYPHRRGGVYIPPRPVNVDSSPMIAGLNRALMALSETDNTFGGHRETAIKHIYLAIKDLENPDAKGQGNGAPAARTTAISQGDPYISVRKALSALYAIHHKLDDKSSTVGRIHADAEVRIAISELILAEKTVKPAPTAAPAHAPARPAPFSFTTRPVQ